MHNIVGPIDMLIYSAIVAIVVISITLAVGVFYLARWIGRALTKRKVSRK